MVASTLPGVRLLQSPAPALPVGAGVGLKPEHYSDVLDCQQHPAFLEVHAENYLCGGGPAHRYLERIRADFRLSIHGVGLSLGGAQAPDRQSLIARRELVDRYQPDEFSEHLAWSSLEGEFFNDLLPLAYTRETLDRVAAHVGALQDALRRRVLIENPATYLRLDASTMSETGFLAELARRTGCGLLLDVNNVVVCAANHGFEATDYIDGFPLAAVAQIHVAGHSAQVDSAGHALLIDSHDSPVQVSTWALYETTLERTGPLPTLLEWDSALPGWPSLVAEAALAAERLDRFRVTHAAA